jgi:hypothetical protein
MFSSAIFLKKMAPCTHPGFLTKIPDPVRLLPSGRNIPYPMQTRSEGKGCQTLISSAPFRQSTHFQASFFAGSAGAQNARKAQAGQESR